MSADATAFESAACFDEFVAMVEDEVGCPIPRELRPADRPWRRGPAAEFWQAGDYPLMSALFQDAIRSIAAEAPDEHGLLGFFGHGVNSHAFYLGFRTARAFVHLRLPFGGVYGELDAQRRDIAILLGRVAELVRRGDSAGATVSVVYSMGGGDIEVSRANGASLQASSDDLDSATAFARLLAAIGD